MARSTNNSSPYIVANDNSYTEQTFVANELQASTKEGAVNTKEGNIGRNDFQRGSNKGDEIESIYLDDGSHKKKSAKVNKPQRKLTKVCI